MLLTIKLKHYMQLAGLLLVMGCGGAPAPEGVRGLPAGDYAWFDTTQGEVIAQLETGEAPRTVANFADLANARKPFRNPRTHETSSAHYYDGLAIHRIVKNLLVQGGDPLANGVGDPGWRVPLEISPNLHFTQAGLLVMSNTGAAGASNGQFFITLAPAEQFEGRYAIFGHVVRGMENVQKWAEAPLDHVEIPVRPITLRRVRVYRVDARHGARLL